MAGEPLTRATLPDAVEEAFPGVIASAEDRGLLPPEWRRDADPYEMLDVFLLGLILLPQLALSADQQDRVLLQRAFTMVEELLDSPDPVLAQAAILEFGEGLAGACFEGASRLAGPRLLQYLRSRRSWEPKAEELARWRARMRQEEVDSRGEPPTSR